MPTKRKAIKVSAKKAEATRARSKKATAKKAKTEKELAEARIKELQYELAEAAAEAERLAYEEFEKKAKTKKVYALVQGCYYFSAMVPAGEVTVYEDENGELVTDADVMSIGQDAFRAVFDEGGDAPFRIHGYMTEGSFDASDYDNYELYLDKAGTKHIRWND